jgi:hypothetical protein
MAQPRHFCIFCGGGDLSKEHFWPQWAFDLLPESSGHKIMRALGDGPLMTHRDRQGATKTVTLRVVCRKCNTGWISRMEGAVRPLLTPLIVGQPIFLTVENQHALAEWIALKVILLEQSDKSQVVVTQAERTAFYESRQIPANMRIRLAVCGEGGWRCATVREAVWLTPLSRFQPQNGRMNVQVSTIGAGDLLIHASVCNADGFDIDEAVPVNPAVFCLWPPSNENLNWPQKATAFNSDAAAVLAKRVARLKLMGQAVRM